MSVLMWVFCILHFLVILSQSTQTSVIEISRDLNPLSSKVEDFKVNLHRILEGSRVRKKRQLESSYGSSPLQVRVGSAAPEELPYLSDYKLSFWTPVHYRNQSQVLVGTQEGHLILLEISDTDDRAGHSIALSYEEEVGAKAKAFNYYEEQWFIVLQSASNLTWIRLYLKVGRGLEQRQSITLDGETDFDLVTVKGVHYMAVTTFKSSTNQASLFLYHWTQTQFDLIATRTVFGPRSVACWVLDGALYIVLAQRADGFHYSSPLYLYNAKDENGLVLQQLLSVYGPVKVLHFYVSSSHYILFIGSQNAAIYWWSSNQFLLWQVIQNTAGAIDASIITLTNGEVVIVIALKEEVLFATLDSSGYYVVSFTMSFSGYSLSSLQFMYSGKAYYALALFAASYKQHVHPIWKLTLEPYFVPSESSLDVLRQCLKDVADVLDERQAEMNNIHIDTTRVWLKNKDQKVSAEVFIAGEISSNTKSMVSEILVISDRKILPESSLAEVDTSLSRLNLLSSSLQDNLKRSVRKTIQQNITGMKYFHDTLIIPSLNLKSSTNVPINGVTVSKVNQYALRSTGNNTFTKPIEAVNVLGSELEVEYLNAIDMNEFLLLKGPQSVTGNFKYVNAMVSDLQTDTVNSIPLDHLVTTSSGQSIKDLKSLSHLKSPVINVNGQINGEKLNELFPKIMQTSTDNEIKRQTSLNQIIEVKGDIFLTGLINGKVDLQQLVERSVMKNTDQDLKGHFTLASTVNIKENLLVDGYVNNLDLKQLATLSTDQTLSGHFFFALPFTVQNNLMVDSINNLKLREDAVLKTMEPQFVSGIKIFNSPLTADFIDMTEYATLDGVDPSLLVQDIVKHKEGVIQQDYSLFHDAKVIGNVTVIGDINGRPELDFRKIFWLKNSFQDIEVAVKIKKVTAKNDMDVESVNNINLEYDLVKSFIDETIISSKYFKHNVLVSKNMGATAGAMINGMEIISFKMELDDYSNEGTVHGKKILSDLEINGDLDAILLNNFDLLRDVLQPHVYQEVTAPAQFPSELTLIQDFFEADEVWFNLFNGINLKSYLEDAMSKTKPNQTIKNKRIPALKAAALSLPDANTINDIPIAWLLERVVTLNTKQQIIANKNFLNDLKLNKLTVISANGKNISDVIAGVVTKDDSHSVSSKEFLGAFMVPNLFTNHLVNGIDINELSQKTFLKTQMNEVKIPFIFRNSIDIGKLITAFRIDGTNWDNLVFTKQAETLGPMWLMSNANLLADVFVTGLVNGCDLLQLKDRALYSNKTTQIIQEEITIESIEVVGNVNVEAVINEVPVQTLLRKLILVTTDQLITSDVILGTGVETTNLNIAKISDYWNLPFIIDDAVRSSLPQVVRGYKKFRSITTDVLDASELFITKLWDTINLNDLYKNIVWKNGYQIIEGEKIFTSLKTDVATVQGHLNGLSLPGDIIKTDTNEHITSPVLLMSNLLLASDIFVQGKLDGINVTDLVLNRITLATNQNVYSQLSFAAAAEVKGDLNLDGMINDVVLELVTKTTKNFPLHGYKVFTGNFYNLGHLKTSSVNGYSIEMLEQNILKRNEEEFLKELQVFEKPLRVESNLFIDWINNLSLSEIATTFFSLVSSFNKTLNYLEELGSGFLQQTIRQTDAVGSKVSRFAFFVLLQEINLGPTMKILQGYCYEHSASEFSHSMVIWTTQKHCSYLEKCCYEDFSHWLRVKRSGHLVVDSQPEPGRLYPFYNPAPVTTDKNFFIWTNSTSFQAKWCGNREEKMLLASFTDLKYLEVFLDLNDTPTLSDVRSFRQGHLYAVAGFYYDRKEDTYSSAVVYKFDEVTRQWSEHQILSSYGVLSLDTTLYLGDAGEMNQLLAIGTGVGSLSHVYKWNALEHKFALLQSIPSRYATSTIWLMLGSTQLLAMANVEEWPSKETFCSDMASGGEINIYTYDGYIRLIQSIPLDGVISMVHFKLEGEVFLVAASSKLQTIHIYEWKGYAGFSLIQSLFVAQVTHLNTYRIGEDLYMTVATASGPAKVLKVIVQGKHTDVTWIHNKVLPPDYQKDQAKKEEKIGC